MTFHPGETVMAVMEELQNIMENQERIKTSVVVNSATLFGNSAVRQHYSSATGPIGNGTVRQLQFGNMIYWQHDISATRLIGNKANRQLYKSATHINFK